MRQVSVLFVCLGNICRSPMAESIFRHKVQRANLEDLFFIDSAGTGNWHVGDSPDFRTIRVLRDNGITDYSRGRQVRGSDFDTFDYVIAMDDMNIKDLSQWQNAKPEKISLMLNWGETQHDEIVPDPYYGEHQDFVEVYQLLDSAADQLLDKLLEIHQISRTD